MKLLALTAFAQTSGSWSQLVSGRICRRVSFCLIVLQLNINLIQFGEKTEALVANFFKLLSFDDLVSISELSENYILCTHTQKKEQGITSLPVSTTHNLGKWPIHQNHARPSEIVPRRRNVRLLARQCVCKFTCWRPVNPQRRLQDSCCRVQTVISMFVLIYLPQAATTGCVSDCADCDEFRGSPCPCALLEHVLWCRYGSSQ